MNGVVVLLWCALMHSLLKLINSQTIRFSFIEQDNQTRIVKPMVFFLSFVFITTAVDK